MAGTVSVSSGSAFGGTEPISEFMQPHSLATKKHNTLNASLVIAYGFGLKGVKETLGHFAERNLSICPIRKAIFALHAGEAPGYAFIRF